ncbi:MAG: glycosyltransferase family 4 protein [Pseudanabaenaceae cyanobacterium]
MSKALHGANIAIVHEWLTSYAGSERVLEQMLALFPQADLFAVADFLPQNQRHFLQNKPVTTTFIQHLPQARQRFRQYLPLMPLAIEQLDLSGYDIVLSSCHAVAKGVLTGPDQLHIAYIHSPIRYAWDLQHQYLQQSGLTTGVKSWLARYLLHQLRLWDTRTANGVDYFVANSRFIGRRIQKVYRRPSEVIYPPVDLDTYSLHSVKSDFYVTASRLVPYKRVDLIVEAFAAMPHRQLVVIGTGEQMKLIQAKATPNIKLLGFQPPEVLQEYLKRAKAFVFAAEEDFGITPVEAQACGTPVIAFGRGGVCETVRPLPHDAPTGVFFAAQEVAAVIAAVTEFEANQDLFTPEACRNNALRFGVSRFREEFGDYVADQWQTWQQAIDPR